MHGVSTAGCPPSSTASSARREGSSNHDDRVFNHADPSEGVLAGPAFTVKTRPGDKLMVHKALDLAASGDVILGDEDGLLCVPFDAAAKLLADTQK